MLSSLASDPEMSELIDLFVNELSRRMQDLESCCAERDWNSVRTIAHQLKGASAGYGFAPVGDLAGEVELRAIRALQSRAQSDIERTVATVQELVSLCKRVRSS